MSDNIKGGVGRMNVGSFTANETTEVTFTNQAIKSSSAIFVTLRTVGGTPAGHPYISTAPTAGSVGFKAASGDTSVYDVYVF